MPRVSGNVPAPIVQADQALHELYQRVHFSRFLNPVNAPDARRLFLAGAPAPPFEYQAAVWADAELRNLDALPLVQDHPLGVLMARAIQGTRHFILALRDRTPEAFDALARSASWYPNAATLTAATSEVRDHDASAFTLQAGAVAAALEQALVERGLLSWVVEMDPVMSARVLVDGAKRLIKVSPMSRFRDRDVARLIAHEVEVHAWRSANGSRQSLRLFSTGLPGSLETEEGLAMVAEERAGAASPGSAWRQSVVVRAISLGRTLGFRDLYRQVSALAGPGLAWGVCLRLKRGLERPELPGVYAKDVVYYRGLRRVRSWLAEGNSVANLYVGKVGIDDPVDQWLQEGWVTRQRVPPLFLEADEA
jgi:hypothetical protein